MKFAQAYEKMDSTIMRGASVAVMAWNWTTGRTKAALANTLIVVGNSSWVVGAIEVAHRQNGYLAVALTPPLVFISAVVMKKNVDTENLERIAIKKQAKDIKAERNREQSRFLGPYEVIASPIIWSLYNNAFSAGFTFFLGANNYIMRVDPPMPRRNALARGMDRLKGVIRDRQLDPQIPPVTT